MINKNNPIFSIIIPIYNLENYIEKCISSILNQSFNRIEVVLIDDGSTDSSALICKNFYENNENIIFVKKKMKGRV